MKEIKGIRKAKGIIDKLFLRFKKSSHLNKKNNSIRKKIFLSITIMILIAVIVIGGTASLLCYKSTFDTLEQTMHEVAKASSEVITKELNTYKIVASEVGLIPQLSQPDITLEEKANILNSRIEMLNLMDLNVANKEGVVVSTETGNSEVVSHQEYFKEAMNGEIYVSNAQFDGKTFEMYFMVVAPLWKDGIYGSTVDGAVILKIDGRTVSEIVSNVVVGEAGFASIIDKSGYTIGHSDYNKVLELENIILNYEADGSNEELALLEQKMLSKETNFGRYRSSDGSKLLAYALIEGTDGWGILVEAPQSEYIGSTYFSIGVNIGLGVLAILMSTVIGFSLSNRISRPIIAGVDRLHLLIKGDLHSEVPKATSSDETGLLLDSVAKTVDRFNIIIRDVSYCLGELSKGNLAVDVDMNYEGDFLMIAESIKKVVRDLNNMMLQIDESADQVANGSEQVSAGAQVLSQGATEQASSIEELAATIAEITEQITHNAENANKAKNATLMGAKEVENGKHQLENMLYSMNEINSTSVEIGKIIKVIDDIAFQTNILALNAAVEAARAGSAGKGFAVVADEVRNLASKSAEAAKTTTQLIESSLSAITKGTKVAEEVEYSFKSIVEKVSDTVYLVEEISTASEQQSIATSQVNVGIEQISSVVQTNSATAEESAAASEELSGQAILLKDLLSGIILKQSSVDNI